MNVNIRVRVLEGAKENAWSLKDEKTGEVREGVTIKQAVRYTWGENSTLGVIRLENKRDEYPTGEYEIHPDSFELVEGTLRTRKFLKLVSIESARKVA